MSRHLKCNRRTLVVVAVGKWESRGLCEIPKRSGKVRLWAFPRSVFSTAFAPAALGLADLALFWRFRALPPVRQLVNSLEFSVDDFCQLDRIQRPLQFFQNRKLLRIPLLRGHHPLEVRLRCVINAPKL